ncbi:MAG: hypothetical protein M0Z67_15340 [Nitrospiraceae bacterium]|nr:hypothetical protein [Nitrospiraceae bacterium]
MPIKKQLLQPRRREKQVHEPPLAFISHRTRSRIRIRVPSKKGDHAFFASVAEKMSAVEGIGTVGANPLTASVLLLHSSDPDRIIERSVAEGFFRIGDAAHTRTNLHRRVFTAFDTADAALRDVTGNELDVGGTAFLALVGMGIYQIWRGNIAAIPWYAAAWYALNIFLKSNTEKQPAQ